MKNGNEARVGIVVVGALALMTVGYFFLRGIAPGADNYYLRLSGPANVTPGNEVRLQGVKIGRVQSVALDDATQKPLLRLAVTPSHLLKDYEYSVRSTSLVGEPYIDIRGPYTNGAPQYAPNTPSDIITGSAQAGLADLGNSAQDLSRDVSATLKKLNVTLDRVNNGVLSTKTQTKLVSALDNVAKLTQRAQSGFGPQGIRITLGDSAAQNNLNRTLASTAQAADNLNRTLQGSRGQLNATLGNLNRASGNAVRLTDGLNGTLGENRAQLKALLTNFDRTAKNAADLTESLNFIVSKGGLRENASSAFGSLNRAAQNIEASTRNFKILTDDKATQNDLKGTLTALRQTTEALRDTATSIQTSINDPATREGIRTTLQSLSQTAKNLEVTTANFSVASEGIKNVIGDPQVQSDLKATVANLNGTLTATRGAAERIGGLLGGRRKKNDDSTQTADGDKTKKRDDASTRLPQGLDFTLRGLRRTPGTGSRLFGDITLNTELFGTPIRTGFSSIGDGTNFTLQGGKYVGRDAAIRYGLYRSKLGVGAQIQRGRLSLEGNLYDLNKRSANLYLGLQVTKSLEVIAGQEKIGGVRTNAVGVRIRP